MDSVSIDSDRGSSLVSFVLLFPVLILFLELIVLGGRIASTTADVRSIAREAARQATVSSGPGAADEAIDQVVNGPAASTESRCRHRSATLGSGTHFVPGGQVEVDVVCSVDLSDLGLLSVPGSITIRGSATEPVDRYRVVD